MRKKARKHIVRPNIRNFLARLGPGLITGASDDDPSGIATYSQSGSRFGYSLLWTMVFSYPLMVAIQEISARIGAKRRTSGKSSPMAASRLAAGATGSPPASRRISLTISRIGHSRGRPVAQGFGKCDAITRHSASVRSVWYRVTGRLCCFEWLASTWRIQHWFEKALGIKASAMLQPFQNCH
jgi:Natural resistance-associated macrophage protein